MNRELRNALGAGTHARVRKLTFTGGIVALDDAGTVIAPGDAYEQTRYILDQIGELIGRRGRAIEDVVRTRISLTDMAQFDDVARAHREVLGRYEPAVSVVQVAGLIKPGLVVQIEAEAADRDDPRD